MKTIRAIASCLLAGLVLVSSSYFTVNTHICMGRVQSVSLIEKAEPCAMERFRTMTCHSQKTIKKSHCCEDEQLKFEGKDFSAKFLEISTLQLQLVAEANIFSSADIIPSIDTEFFIDTSPYQPPAMHQDIPVFVQSFLI